MSKTIAVVGAGPGVGLAVAERFGREGFKVALLARRADALEGYANQLRARGIEAAAFPADVMDRSGLAAALGRASARFGTIDVLEYGVSPTRDSLRGPRDITVENQSFHLDLAVLGAVAAVQSVLGGMLQRKSGGLLFTTAASAQYPMVRTGSFGVAAGAALNYARLLHQDLKGDGIYAGIVAIAALVVPFGQEPPPQSPSGVAMVRAEAVAQLHWEIFSKRDAPEVIIGDVEQLKRSDKK